MASAVSHRASLDLMSLSSGSTSKSILHMGWLQQRVPSLLFAVWQPRFAVLKRPDDDASETLQLLVYKSDDTITGVLLASLTLVSATFHDFHAPTKLAFVMEVRLVSGTTACFALQCPKTFKAWAAAIASTIPLYSSAQSVAVVPHASPLAKLLHKASSRCLETFLTAAPHAADDDGKKQHASTKRLEWTLQSFTGDSLSQKARRGTMAINGYVADAWPHEALLHAASPFGWTWTVTDVYTDAPVATFRWKRTGYFTGRLDDWMGDGQPLVQEGFGHYRDAQAALDLYFNVDALLNGLQAYAAQAKCRSQTSDGTQSA
ncbi:Aste57867_13924 [Aphanomyces stellatus]|uniref:Aste57867_13924 protein n=1 Tax=Aphanomyces stellatus TaxID=120398 RepID=A0A485KZE6_9STRA|nr:hypothetical protein As57867_013873 [Aphanomyces stellatus]VFT90754.1 Aste57867_13924 [Aphanomyces stellatus]